MTTVAAQHTLHVLLHESDPAIWRRIEVDGSMTLARFHGVLQAALGWTDSHLHVYADVRKRIWWTAEDVADTGDGEMEEGITVSEALEACSKVLWYTYDLGDNWIHLVTEESSRNRNEQDPEARVLDGAWRVPLEDVGGLDAWYELLKLTEAPTLDQDEQHLVDWYNSHHGPYTPLHPAEFDAAGASSAVLLHLQGTPRTTCAGVWLDGLDPYARSLFAGALFRAGLDIFDPGPPAPMPREAPAAMEAIRWWIEACTGEGLALTAAGYLAPSVIPQVIAGIGWEHEEFAVVGVFTEASLHPVLGFREAMMGMALLKVHGRRLLATPAAERLAGDPQSLWRQLARCARNSRKNAREYDTTMLYLLALASDEHTDDAGIKARVNEGLRLMGYVNSDDFALADGAFLHVGQRLTWIIKAFRTALLPDGNTGRAGEIERDFARAVLRS